MTDRRRRKRCFRRRPNGLCATDNAVSATSELQAQHELKAPRCADPSGAGVQLGGDDPELAGPIRDIGIRIAVDGMVEQVKGLDAEIQGQPFVKGRFLLERRVDFIIPGSTCNVASQVPPRVFGRCREGRDVEPVVAVLVGRVNGHAGDQVGPLSLLVAVGQGRRFPVYLDVNRATAHCRRDPTQLPAAQQLSGGAAGVQETLAVSKRKLIDGIDREGLANVNVRTAIITSDTRHVFNVRGVARSEPFVSQTVRPHVLRSPKPSTAEMTLQGYLKRVEVAVAEVIFIAVLAKCGYWALARYWIDDIGL